MKGLKIDRLLEQFYNFIIMFDLKAHQSKKYKSINKSTTATALPDIKKQGNFKEPSHNKNRSGYL